MTSRRHWLLFVLSLGAAATAPAQALVHRDAPVFEARQAVFDPVRGRLAVNAWLGETWECDGTAWFRRAVTRTSWNDARLVWDGAKVFATVTNRSLQTETWSYDGFRWQRRPLPTQPPGRTDAMFAYDSMRGRAVLFGGTAAVGPNYYLTDTWEWDGATWTQRTPPLSPSWRHSAAMAFDPVRGVTVLFGGNGQTGFSQQTWEWDGVTWSLRNPPTAPSARTGSAMTFDAGRGHLVLHGGLSAAGLESDLWEYDGVTWLPVPAINPGPQGYQHSLHHDPASGELLAFLSDPPSLHLFDGTSWRPGPALPLVAGTGGPSRATIDPATGGVLRFGSLFDNATRVWDRSHWHTLQPTPSPPARIFASAWNDGTSAYLFGGINTLSAGTYGDTWRWNGAAWSPVAGPGPSPRYDTAIAYDSQRGVAVLFGGFTQSTLGDTWTFDGTSWQYRTTPVQPPVRRQHGLAFDPMRGVTVMFGGTGFSLAQVRNDTWEWNGTAWSQVFPPTTPPTTGTVALGYDARRQRVLLSQSGSQTVATMPPQLWTFDGATWTPLPLLQNLEVQPVHTVLTLPGELDPLLVDGYSILQLTDHPGAVSTLGAGCGTTPLRLWVRTPPRPGSAQFGLEVEDGPAMQPAALLLALAQGNLVVGGCTIGVDPHGAVWLTTTDSRGATAMPLPLPQSSALLGLEAFGQAFALAPGAAGGFVTSATLRVVLGN